MQEIFIHQFRSISLVVFIFIGLTLVGFGLGFMFWLDFRRRFANVGRLAGWIVLIGSTFMGMVFGYLATQPGYFNQLSADAGGITVNYALPASRIRLVWNDIDQIEIQNDRLVIMSKTGIVYYSPVVYRGDQARLMRSIQTSMPKRQQ